MSWLDIFRRKKEIEAPRQVNIEAPSLSGDKLKNIKVKKVGLVEVIGGRDQFNGPDFDLEEILNAYNTDGYIRQALDKYIELMFKAGWSFSSKNANALEYIKLRFAYMALATGQPTEQLFIEMSEDLVKYSNVFVAKSRTQIPGVKAKGITGSQPIAGYFILSPLTIGIARDTDGTTRKYQQTVPGASKPIEIKPEDMVHIYYKRERGDAFGTPFLVPVLDDVKLLRQLEENVARLVYKHLHPLYKYKVGLAQAGYESDEDEIDQVKMELEEMPLEGGLVLPERHDVDVVGAEGQALSVENYLKYFEQRVFTGLGVSASMMGRSDSSNRSTAETQSSEMHDRVKAFQKTLALFINSFIINELLLEGGFDPINRPEDTVSFQFTEIDLGSKIAVENHAIQKFVQNTISHDEFRSEIGMDPVTDYSKYFYTLFPGKVASTGEVENKNQPANQNGARGAPKTK